MKCPACNIDLLMTERQGIEIDYCPQCRGIWLDKGELDKIIERSQSEISSNDNYYEKDDKHYKHDNDDDHRNGDNKGKVTYDKYGRPIKRRGGIGEILGNLFD